MKKFTKAAIVALLVAGLMTACGGKTYECSLCEETYEGKANVVKQDGKKAELCDGCYELYQLTAPFMALLGEDE